MSFEGDAITAAAGVAPVTEEVTPEAAAAVEPVEGAPAAAPDLSARFDQLEGSLAELARRMPAPAAAPVEEEEAEPEYTAADLLAELEAENFADDGALTADGLVALVKEQARREFAARDRSDAQRRAAEDRMTQMNALAERFPALEKDPEVQTRVVDATAALAKRLGAQSGTDWRVLAQSPLLVEQVYIGLYEKSGSGDGVTPSAQTPTVPVERPSGAGGAPVTTSDPDEGDLIVQRAQAGHRVARG